MSLKSFHFLFIIIADIITLGFAYWAFQQYAASGHFGMLALAGVSFAASTGLAVYFFWFLRKTKGLPS